MWEYSNCNDHMEQNYCDKKCCCEEQDLQQKQMVCCKKIREDICCYYPTFWQAEKDEDKKDYKQGNKEKFDCKCNSKENCFKKYEQESYNHNREEECFGQYNCSKNKPCYEQEKQYFKPKKRCCFCDLFNCICGRR